MAADGSHLTEDIPRRKRFSLEFPPMMARSVAVRAAMYLFCLPATVLVAHSAFPNRTVAADGLPSDVAKTLAHNAKALSPLAVTWERTRTSPFSEKELGVKFGYAKPDLNFGFLEPETVRMQIDGVKF